MCSVRNHKALFGSGETLRLKALSALPKVPSSIPRTQRLTISNMPSSGMQACMQSTAYKKFSSWETSLMDTGNPRLRQHSIYKETWKYLPSNLETWILSISIT